MPRMTGLEVFDYVIEFDASIDVVLMTSQYSTESAVEAVRRGAADYLNSGESSSPPDATEDKV
jgi:DNA-binding NtrC family response regulator